MHRQIKFRQYSIWWVGSGNFSRLVSETSVKLALKMALYTYSTRERLTCPTKVSDKQVEITNAEVKRAQEEDASGRGKYGEYTPEERAQIGKFAAEHGPAKAVRHFSKLLSRKVQLSIHSSASIFALRHLDRTFEPGGEFGLRIRSVTITYDIIACENKTAKLKSAKWNWRPIRQIKFPPNFPAIQYSQTVQFAPG